MNKITWMVKTKDGYEPIGESTMKVSTAQIEFLAKCISSASNDGFFGVDIDTAFLAMYEFGFTEEDVKQLGLGGSLDGEIVKRRLTNFFNK